MLEELIKFLTNPEAYEWCWHDGELYLRPEGQTGRPSGKPAREIHWILSVANSGG